MTYSIHHADGAGHRRHQYLYGINHQHHAGNTYTFGDSSTYHETIWDAGGSTSIMQESSSLI